MSSISMDQFVSMCKQRGFIFPGSEIYGGLANTWDYGPLGVELKRNLKDAWWKYFIQDREDMVGLDSAILMNPRVWEASGHVDNFNDPLIECKNCHERHRADKLIEEKFGIEEAVGKDLKELYTYIVEKGIACPKCGQKDFTEPQHFNGMFETHQGAIRDTAARIYMRPETAQGIFVNFQNVLNATRKKLPFGIGQIGKSFRNEITPGNFTFRTREFEQAEIEYFVQPGTEKETFKEWCETYQKWLVDIGVDESKMRFRDHTAKELSHYSDNTRDIEFNFPFGWGELMGIASRTNFDLTQHEKFSGTDMKYFDAATNEKFIPYVVEPALGMDRLFLVVLLSAYHEEDLGEGKTRFVSSLHPTLAPIKIAILPLKRNEERIVKQARELFDVLKTHWTCMYDDTGSIGKLYRRQDEVGTPYCITVDFETIEDDQAVTVRERDSMKQERVKIAELVSYFKEKL